MKTDKKKDKNPNDFNPDNPMPKKDSPFSQRMVTFLVFVIISACMFIAFYNVFYIIKSNSLFYYGGIANHPVLYTKDDGVYIHKLGEDKSQRITELEYSKSQFSKDGKRIFILCKGKLLYVNFNNINYNDINSSIKEIDSNVTDFFCNPEGRYVAYKKKNSLYACNIGNEPFLISNNVFSDFFINMTDGNIIYTVYNSDLCVFDINHKNTIRTYDVNYYEFKNGYSSKLYYISGDNLYYRENGNTPVMMSNRMSGIITLNSTLFITSQHDNYFSLYKAEKQKIRLINKNITSISKSFGTTMIYKCNSLKGSETFLLNESGKSCKIFDVNSTSSNYTVSKDGRSMYALMNYKKEGSDLMKFTLDNKGINERIIISDNVLSYFLADNGNLIYTTAYGTYIYSSAKAVLLSTYNVSGISCTDDAVYFTETIDDTNFNIMRIKNGSVQFLVENADKEYDPLTASDIIYIQNEGLYFKHGNEESTLIDNNVKSIIETTKYK